MSRELFERVGDALGGMVPIELATFEHRAHGAGIKVWWGDETREHYEAQLVRLPDHRGPTLEIGFHAEHRDAARNDRVIDLLARPPSRIRRALGEQATAGSFLGARARPWRRLSEVWDEVDVDAGDLAVEVADRLARYIAVLEPRRRTRPRPTTS